MPPTLMGLPRALNKGQDMVLLHRGKLGNELSYESHNESPWVTLLSEGIVLFPPDLLWAWHTLPLAVALLPLSPAVLPQGSCQGWRSNPSARRRGRGPGN